MLARDDTNKLLLCMHYMRATQCAPESFTLNLIANFLTQVFISDRPFQDSDPHPIIQPSRINLADLPVDPHHARAKQAWVHPVQQNASSYLYHPRQMRSHPQAS